MKLRFLDRIVFFLGSVFIASVGIAIIVLSFQFSEIDLIKKDAGIFSLQRILLMAVGMISLGFAVYLLTLPRKFARKKRGFVTQKTENGELRIAIKAIEHLVQRCIDMHNEIKVLSVDISNNHDGVRIELRISLANNISIPLAVASLQKQIKQYLLASSGIDIREVAVSVETASSNVGESPYLVEDAINQPNDTAIHEFPENKRKRPLHQRIFGKEEQVAAMPPASENNGSVIAQQRMTPDTDALPAEPNAAAASDIPVPEKKGSGDGDE